MSKRDKVGPTYLHTDKDPVWWDWWRENPVEIVLVIFILVFFFAFPRTGCGVTAKSQAPAAGPVAAQPAAQPAAGPVAAQPAD